MWKSLIKTLVTFLAIATTGVGSIDANLKGKATCGGADMCNQHNSFCQPFYYRKGGVCEPCWKCCAFLKVAGESLVFDSNCATFCRCAEDGVNFCSSAWDCGEGGMYCDHSSGGFCRSCINCNHEQCANDCQGFKVDDVIDQSTFQIAKAHAYYQVVLGETNIALKTREARDCPQLYGTGRDAIQVTKSQCPCAPWKNATQLRCPIGHACVAKNTLFAESDAIMSGASAWLGSTCEPCSNGSLCDIEGLVGRDSYSMCPSGFFCPTPSSKIMCPHGAFCPEGSQSPKTCDYTTLIIQDAYLTTPPKLIIERILLDQDPFRGNFCPGGMSGSKAVPMHVCPAGYFCPNASVLYACPRGFFCRKQSVAPVPCPPLTRCEVGTSSPKWSGIIIIFYATLVLVAVLVKFMKMIYTNSFNTTPPSAIGINGPDIAYCGSLINPVISIEYENLSAKLANDQNAHPWLWCNSGTILPQKLNAIMGSSGCGKSTLIEMLRGRVHSGMLTGKVVIVDSMHKRLEFSMNELKLPNTGNMHEIRRLVGFVPQDDVLLGELTVRENLVYSAYLKLPEMNHKRKAIDYLVSCVCEKLGFDLKLQTMVVGTVDRRGISGGQRKRVSIGMELVGMHPIIMMDEPTSGLDASGSHRLLDFTKRITHMGCTIIAVVHQPRCSSFLLFDQVLLLSRYGCAFCGSPYEAVAYYECGMLARINVDDNPADAIMDLLTYGIDGVHIIEQKEQADLWSQSGIEWLRHLRKSYQVFDHMMAANVAYTGDVERVILLGVRNERLCADLLLFFENLGIYGVSIQHVQTFLYRNKIEDVEALLKVVKNMCWSNLIKGTYDNTILKLGLLPDIPVSFISCTNGLGLSRLRASSIALEFGRRLMKKAGIPSRGSNIGLNILEREFLLAVLIIKAHDATVRELQEKSSIMHMRNVFTNTSLQGLQERIRFHSSNKIVKIKPIWVLVKRKLCSLSRSPWPIQLVVPSVAAVIVGLIHGSDWNVTGFPSNIVMAMACIGVLSMVTHVRTFSLDKLFIRREVHNNVSLFAYYIAYNIVDIVWILAIPLVFFIPYYYLTFPLTHFMHFYIAGVLVCWWASGVAYILSASSLALHWANLIGVFIAIIFGAFIHGLNPTISEARGTPLQWLIGLSYNRWAMEDLVIREMGTRQYVMPNVVFVSMQRLGLCNIDQYANFKSLNSLESVLMALKLLGSNSSNIVVKCREHLTMANTVLLCQGIGWRVVAFVMMWTSFDTMVQRNITRFKQMLRMKA